LKLHNLFACGKQNLQRQQKMTAIQTRLSYFGKIHSQDIKFLVALKREVPETRILTERITSLEKELKEKDIIINNLFSRLYDTYNYYNGW